MPTLTPELTALGDAARGLARRAASVRDDERVDQRAHPLDTPLAVARSAILDLAWAGERAASAISGVAQSRTYERHSRSSCVDHGAGRERHQRLRPGPAGRRRAWTIGLQEPLVAGEHVPAQCRSRDRGSSFSTRTAATTAASARCSSPRVVADRPERADRQHELDQEDDGDDSAADQDPSCQADAHVGDRFRPWQSSSLRPSARSSRAASSSTVSRSRSSGATGWRWPARTGPARRRCCARSRARCPSRAASSRSPRAPGSRCTTSARRRQSRHAAARLRPRRHGRPRRRRGGAAHARAVDGVGHARRGDDAPLLRGPGEARACGRLRLARPGRVVRARARLHGRRPRIVRSRRSRAAS